MDKTCTICGIPKDLEKNFYKAKTTKDGHWGQCKKCVASRSRTQWASLPQEEKARRISRSTERHGLKRLERLVSTTKSRALKSNIPFNIEPSDIVIPEKCPYLGITLFHGAGKLTDNSPSLDKIIPELGYIKGNIQVLSHKANAMKRNASIEELLAFSHAILNQFGDK